MSKSTEIAVLFLGLSILNGAAYAQLENQPPERETPALTADQVSRLKKDLAGTRDRQNARTKTKETTPASRSKKP